MPVRTKKKEKKKKRQVSEVSLSPKKPPSCVGEKI